ncbi:hypothetical protein PanWU01x14_036380 [Parasponia andersonii]|uniref:Uncharacterized protein n=1 Tax=Parasponia andersonii TaxID=3476 RepID=A0A2P5DSF7_PARAD|nr:hypothetical protein PanWU01x14_036380 [Parasponia andersonii]
MKVVDLENSIHRSLLHKPRVIFSSSIRESHEIQKRREKEREKYNYMVNYLETSSHNGPLRLESRKVASISCRIFNNAKVSWRGHRFPPLLRSPPPPSSTFCPPLLSSSAEFVDKLASTPASPSPLSSS